MGGTGKGEVKDGGRGGGGGKMVYGSVASFMVSGVLVLELLSTVSEMQ